MVKAKLPVYHVKPRAPITCYRTVPAEEITQQHGTGVVYQTSAPVSEPAQKLYSGNQENVRAPWAGHQRSCSEYANYKGIKSHYSTPKPVTLPSSYVPKVGKNKYGSLTGFRKLNF